MAKLVGNTTISLDELSQEIDLTRYVDGELTDEAKETFALAAIERINQRTLDGNNIHGRKFKKYSKDYAAKKGVSRDSVDLFLSGDMLNSLDYELTDNGVKIKIDDGDVVKRAYNHQTGDTLSKRQFFGLIGDEVRSITDAIQNEVDIVSDTQETFTLADLTAAIQQLGLSQVE
jgi:phage gpG-like protein